MKNKPESPQPRRLFSRGMVLLYLAAALALTLVHDDFIDARMMDVRATIHQQVMGGTAPAPIQYRVFVYYVADWLIKQGLPFRETYDLIRFTFIFLSALAFHAFLAVWFEPFVCATGVLYLLAVLPLTFLGYYMQPMDLPNLFFFLVGCLLMLRKKDWLLVPLLAVAMTNRETAILLVLVFMLYKFDELDTKEYLLKSGALFITGMGMYVFLRKAFQIKQYYSDLYYLSYNLLTPRTYLFALALFGPFLYFAFSGGGAKPKFLRRALLIIPFFLVIHFTMTIMTEPRLWLPLLPLCIAAGLWAIVPEAMRKKTADEPVVAAGPLSRFPKIAYTAMLGGFMVFFVAFFSYYKDLHMKDRALQLRVDAVLRQSKMFMRSGMFPQALAELQRGLALKPQDDNLHYELAILYEYQMFDRAKAREHFEKCLEYNPSRFDRVRIQDEIDRLRYYLKAPAQK